MSGFQLPRIPPLSPLLRESDKPFFEPVIYGHCEYLHGRSRHGHEVHLQPGHLLFYGNDVPHGSIDHGASWHRLNWLPGGDLRYFWAFAMNPADPAKVYGYGPDSQKSSPYDRDLFVAVEPLYLPLASDPDESKNTE